MIERRFAALFLTSFVLSAGYGSIYTLLAVIREQFGFSATSIGVIGSAGFLAGFSAMVVLSRYADRGHTRSMLQFGLTCAILGNLGMVLATDLMAFIGSRVLLGLGAGAFSPAVRRLVISAEPSKAGERLGFMASFEMGGFISGPVLASLLYEIRPTDPVTFLAMVVSLMMVALLAGYLPSRRASLTSPTTALRSA